MNKPGILGDIGDELKNVGKQAVKTAVKIPAQVSKEIGEQLTGIETKQNQAPANPNQQKALEDTKKQENKDLLKQLYGSSKTTPKKDNPAQNPQMAKIADAVAAGKSPQEAQKIEQLRQTLHQQEYYQPLITRPKKQEEVERPKERVERLEMEELQQEQEKEKKKKPLSVDRAERSVEANRGLQG